MAEAIVLVDRPKAHVKPVVSVIVPVFNTGDFLREAVESVLAQTAPAGAAMPPYEIIVVDDRSTEPRTLEILDALRSRAPAIRVIRNEGAKGAAAARNAGIRLAQGKWLAFLDSDDLWLPDSLHKRWAYVCAHPQARWVAGQFKSMDVSGVVSEAPFSTRSPILYSLVHDDFDAGRPAVLRRPVRFFLQACGVGIGAVLIDRALCLSAGAFDEGLRRAEDYLLWVRCAVMADLHLIPDDVYLYRLRPGSLTRTTEPTFFGEEQMLERLRADPKFSAFGPEIATRMRLVLSDFCYYYRNARDHRRALSWAWRFVQEAPLAPGAWKQLIAATLHV